jgi:hypothetical protein
LSFPLLPLYYRELGGVHRTCVLSSVHAGFRDSGGLTRFRKNRGLSTAQRTVRLSGASIEMTFVVCCWREPERARLPATCEGAMKATTFVAISEGLRVKTHVSSNFGWNWTRNWRFVNPSSVQRNVIVGAGLRQLLSGGAFFGGAGWWRTGDGERWPVCGRFDVKAGQVVSSVLAR